MAARLGSIGLAIIAIGLYGWCLVQVVGIAVALPFPSWWLQLVPRASHGILARTVLCHTIAIVMVALPFAWLFCTRYGPYAVYLACVAAGIITVPEAVLMLRQHSQTPFLLQSVRISDIVILAGTLPLLTLLFRHRSLTHVGADRDE